MSPTQRRLKESLQDIKKDYDKGASVSFLSRKYFVSRPTMKSFVDNYIIKKDNLC